MGERMKGDLLKNDLLCALRTGSPIERLAALRVLVSASLYLFARIALGKDFLRPEPHARVCEFMTTGESLHRLLVLPRSFLKSTLCSLSLPLWWCLQDPSLTTLIVTNSDDNARKMLGEIRNTLEKNALIKALWPDVVPASAGEAEKWSDSQVCLKRDIVNKEMTFEAAGVNTTIVGRHYRRIIIDDPVAAKRDDKTGEEAAPTKEDIDNAIRFMKHLRPFFTDPLATRIMHSGTRWAHYDPISYLKGLKRADGSSLVPVLELAAIDDEGQPTYDRYPLPVLEDIRLEVGPYLWASQYMNHPVAEEDRLFRREHLRFWSRTPATDAVATLPELKDLWITMTVDPANREKKHHDYTAMVVVGSDAAGNWYVLDYVKKRMPPEDTIRAAIRLYEKWGVRVMGIETIAAQIVYKKWIDDYAKEHDKYVRTKELKSKTIAEAKMRRIESIQPLVVRGQLFLEQGRSASIEQEMEEYPNGRFDDLLDALAYQKQLVRKPTSRQAEETVGAWAENPNGGPPLFTYEGMMADLRRAAGRGPNGEVPYVARDFVA